MKRLLLLLLCMLAYMPAYMPAAFASTWQENVDAAASDPKKIYEVYRGMPYADFEKAWADVPNWKIKDEKPRWKVFEKNFEGKKPLREEFLVMCDNTNVISIEVGFFSNNKKLLNEIFDYSRARLAEKIGNDGQVEGCDIDDPSHTTFATWPGMHIMLTRNLDEKGGKTYLHEFGSKRTELFWNALQDAVASG